MPHAPGGRWCRLFVRRVIGDEDTVVSARTGAGKAQRTPREGVFDGIEGQEGEVLTGFTR